MTPTKALRSALVRAGEDRLAVQLGLISMTETRQGIDEVTKELPDPSLILRLNGPSGAVGLVIACPQVTGAVIEAKTFGRVVEGVAQERKATRTDARLVSGFVDHMLTQFAISAQGCDDIPPVAGFKSGVALAEARVAVMALADEKHVRYQMEVDFSGGAKTGKLVLIFPSELVIAAKVDKVQEAWRSNMEKAVMGANSRLEAILCRMRIPLSELTALRPGDILHLKDASLDNVSLQASDQSKIITAQLGRFGPVRAVRVFLAGDPPKRSAPPEGMMPLSMDKSGGIGTMSGVSDTALAIEPVSVPPQFDLPTQPFAAPGFEMPEAEDGEMGFPEGGFPINRLEAS
jgi:flagellar motor switch protein FliM